MFYCFEGDMVPRSKDWQKNKIKKYKIMTEPFFLKVYARVNLNLNIP